MRRKIYFGWVWGMALAVILWTNPTSAADITIAAASDLNFAFKEIVPLFEKKSGESLSISFGSSGNFYAQILNGAPFDLFFSADINYPSKLEEAGLADPGMLHQYASGRIVIWVPKDSPIDVKNLGMKALLEPSVKKIAIANPNHAPYGMAAVEAMNHFKIYESVKEKLVLGENVSQAAQFVESGAADLGMIALSLALGPTLKERGLYWEVPVKQGVVVLKKGKNPKGARDFLLFLQGVEGRNILEKYGFITAPWPRVIDQ